MPVISCQNLEKSFGPRTILSEVTLTIRSGERVGLVGNNGSGKSTLGRILAGIDEADGGEIAKKRGASFAYLEQEPRFAEGTTPREVVLASLSAWADAKSEYDEATSAIERGDETVSTWIERQSHAAHEIERLGGWERMHEAMAMLGHLGVTEPDVPLARMSGGERRRVALAELFVAAPDLAILDEPTNHLDVLTIEWLERYLIERYKGALLLITHDRYVLDRVVQRTLELTEGRVHSYDGGYEAYLCAKSEREAQAERVESNRQNFLRRELEWLRRQPKARATKQKARIARAQESIAAAPSNREREAKLSIDSLRLGKTILELHEASFAYEGLPLFRDLDFALGKGERIGIIGPNGTGKTSLLRCVLGQQSLSVGELTLGKNTRIGYLDQERSGLCDELTVLENVSEDGGYLEIGGNRIRAGSYLERFLFDGSAQRKKVGVLSGGERARVCLAVLLAQPCNLLLLDEPTNDLDVAMLGALEEMLLDYPGCALIVSHDRWFLDRVATSILAFEGDGSVDLHRGGYSAYKEKWEKEKRAREAQSREARAAARPTAAKVETRDGSPGKPRKLTHKEQRELEGLFDEIEAAESGLAELESRLVDPASYVQGGEEAALLACKFEEGKERVEQLTSRWEELEAIRLGE